MRPPAVLAPLDDLLQDLLEVSLTGVIFYTPRYGPNQPDDVLDFDMAYLNPTAQRLLALPALPTRTHLEQWPHSGAPGLFQFHVEAFRHPDRAVCRYEGNYQADGYDHYGRLAARRCGAGLLVSLTDTADQAPGRPDGVPSFAGDVPEQVRVRQQNEVLQAQLLDATRQQVQQRETFFQAFEQTTAAVALLRGPTHRFDYVNPAYQAFYPSRPLMGLDIVMANPEAVAAGYVALLDQVYQTGEPFFAHELPMAPPDADPLSQPKYFNFSYQAFREAGVITGIYVVAYEVTEQVLGRQERERERLAADRLRLTQQQALFEAVQQAQETERRRIAEELHNGVGQILFATKLRLDQLHALALTAAPALAVAQREAAALLTDAIRQVRSLSHELVPRVLQDYGLALALQDLCRQLSSPQLPLRCSVLLDEQVPPLPALLELALYRMAQELGLNIVKHAHGATEASLELETMPGFVLLRAEDNGPGFAQDPATAAGLGLRATRDRVALLGGQLELSQPAAGGAYVRLRIPLPVAPAAE